MRTDVRAISLIAIFAALGVICDVVITPGFSGGVWIGWIFIISPIAGIVLGPYNGFISTLIAVMIGHSLFPRETIYEIVFTIGAPVGAMTSGFAFRGQLKRVFIYYTIMLGSYFATPISRHLPIWGMWDCYVAYAILIILCVILITRGLDEIKRISPYAISAFIGLEADVLLRIFILVPCQGYRFFFEWTPESLAAIWTVPAPIIIPFKVLLSTFVVTLIGPQIKRIIRDSNLS
ncbi:MAG: hypothetical protein JSW53_06525 [Candidatus Bathyarchaeota archaeon]|nr:MAG: hypothetical protein JSW53_06525 [Candidatus Bathyarchaeota archaeon]